MIPTNVNQLVAGHAGWRSLTIRLDKVDGPLLAKVELGKDADWNVITSKLASAPSGTHDLVIVLGEKSQVELDWIRFD